MQVMSSAEIGDLNLFRRGKVRDTFQLADGTLLMIATDRLSVFDVVLPTPIPGKGTVLTQMSRWWFASDRRRSCRITCSPTTRRRFRKRCAMTGCRARCTSRSRSGSTSSASCADSSADPDGRNTARRERSQASRCRKGCAIPRDSRRRASRRRSRRTTATTSTSRARNSVRWWVSRSRTSWSSASLRLFDFATARCQSAGHLPRRHQVRVRFHQRQAHADRRDLHPRLLALLGDVAVARGRARRLVRQAVRARLHGDTRLGQDVSRTRASR